MVKLAPAADGGMWTLLAWLRLNKHGMPIKRES